jgi:hypothetical protein
MSERRGGCSAPAKPERCSSTLTAKEILMHLLILAVVRFFVQCFRPR